MFLARPDPPREGRPLAVKDLFDTAELTTTYGSAIFRDHVPDRTADAVATLEASGWANVGKTNLHEFAYGVTSQNPHFGTVPNPIAPGRVAGGSSGGSAAAIAAGYADGALGTDSGGSIRIPAAWCGIAGFKPTYGLVSMAGCLPLAPSFDHAGPMARTVRDCAELMGALVPGFEPESLGSLADVRVGAAGVALPGATRVHLPSADEVTPAFQREVAETHAQLFAAHGHLYGENVATKITLCTEVTDAQAERAARHREFLRERFAALFGHFDLLVTPTVTIPPPPADVDELAVRREAVALTIPFNAIGAPALALPWGEDSMGLPVSLQVVAAPGRDALALAAGELLERRSELDERR